MGHSFLLDLWNRLGLWVISVLFLLPLRRRSSSPSQTALAVCGGIALRSVLYHWNGWIQALIWPDFAVSFLLAVALFWLCADVPPPAKLYCGIWTMTLYELSIQLATALIRWGEGHISPLSLDLLIVLLLCGGSAAIGLTLARWMPDQKSYHIGPRQLVSSFVILLASLAILYHDGVMQRQDPSWQGWQFTVLIQIYSATLLYLQHELFRKSAIRQELTILNRLWAEQRAQYNLAKENIALINQKCHDLKHQIQAMRTMFSGEAREQYFQEMEQSIRIYEILAKTGNEVLDTVLTEKSLSCEANGIQAHCVVEGTLLNFMDPVDIYTIFGNAMDNAIESVKKNEAPEKRIIDVLVYAEKQFLVLQIINPVEQELQFDEEGLPLSTKVNDGYHGFGLRSIRHTAKKYEGFLSVKVKDGYFYLRILFPIQKEPGAA